MNSIYLLMGIGLFISLVGLGFVSVYAQDTGPTTVEITMSIITTVVGMIIVLIPVIRREILASKYQNPAILRALEMGENFGQAYLKDQEKFKELAEIAYSGLPQEYVDKIEGKPKVKLAELEKDLIEAKAKYERFIEIYNQLRTNIK